MGFSIFKRCMYIVYNLVNFCVSGNAVDWYWAKRDQDYKLNFFSSFIRLVCKHWGSVVGGALLNAFF